jgi:hypothetical protein
MKLRVETAPPLRRRRDQAHLRDRLLGDVAQVHQPPGGQAHRFDARIERGIGLELVGRLVSGLPKSDARITTTGMPLSISVSSTPSTTSRTWPVGSSAPPVLPPAMSRKSITIGAAVPGTPSMRAWAVVAHAAAGRLHVRDRDAVAVLTMWMRTASAPGRGDQPVLDGERSDSGQHVAAVLRLIDARLVDEDLQEEVVDVGVGPRREPTTATLLVSVSAPPRPSIWRTSGDPIAASSTRSRSARSAGKSEARKNGPFDVPPRISVHGIAVCNMPR